MFTEQSYPRDRLSFDGPRPARVGLVALATDLTSEADHARLLVRPGLELFVSRIANANPVTPDNLRAMAPRLSAATDLLLPGAEIDAVIFSCTSASVLIGDGPVEAAIHAARPEAAAITPPKAAVSGFHALGVTRISMLTPYTFEVSRPMAAYFERNGLAVDRLTALELDDDIVMAQLSSEAIVEAAEAAITPDAEALFISCTAVRSVAVIDRIEAAIGRPVVTSNQAAAWACLEALGLPGGTRAAGRLMRGETHKAAALEEPLP
ncbi:aspartate racemase/maleate isomerase family protein [Jiella marina]|uniref:aspartate racemase/maleate isomerase family protein n=1 Tax=Jiella sp. LLJ827 TaxID=2917712 RepID=UPI002100F2B3|nr:ectoine utilization protein EutA [Jiella sp. LLJ827]